MDAERKRDVEVATRGRGLHEITSEVEALVAHAGVEDGICVLFCPHTSAGLIVQENADPSVRADLERWLSRLAPDGDPGYRHDDEGPDDMAAHLRSVLTGVSLTIPVAAGRLLLGRWQGIYLYEHRHRGQRRSVHVRVLRDTR